MTEGARFYRDLLIWQKSFALVKKVCKTSKQLPAEELYAIKSQIQRCVVSIPSNIAEGQERGAQKSLFTFSAYQVVWPPSLKHNCFLSHKFTISKPKI